MKATHRLEYRIFQSWKKKNHKLIHQKILVGVSGGCDSMALLSGLLACFRPENIIVVHVHHGPGKNKAFRDSALKLVTEFCRRHHVSLELITSSNRLESEADFREFRLRAYQSMAEKYGVTTVALGHHQDDWLENQLIKLIRGSSFSSLRKNFQWSSLKTYHLVLWRPLITVGRKEIENYAHERRVPFLEDPSNRDPHYLRNWLRHTWLPQLEQVRSGSLHRLAHSLIHSLSEIGTVQDHFPWNFATDSIDFIYFLSLSESEKLRCLAYYVRKKEIKGVRANQLKEIIRQLDKDSVSYHIRFKTFECLVNAGQVQIRMRR